MGKDLLTGLVVGGVFCVAVVWGAVASALSASGTVLLAVAVDTLMAGLAVAGLIAANFALRDSEQEKEETAPVRESRARAAA
jgi:hypothetical protein